MVVDRVKTYLRDALTYLLCIIMAFGIMGITLLLLGYNPLHAYQTMFSVSLGSARGITQTFVKFVPLLLAGLAFAIPLNAKIWNIGAEGQMRVGACLTTVILLVIGAGKLPPIILVPLGLLFGLIGGIIWGGIAAAFLRFFRVHEIVTTIVLNFVAFYVVDFIALGSFSDVTAGHPMTLPIPSESRLPSLIPGQTFHIGLIIALVFVAIMFLIMRKSTLGYDIRAIGSNPSASTSFGINVRIIAPLTLIIGGAMAGLGGAIEVMGVHYRLIEGFAHFFMPLGIVIGLLSKGNLLLLPFFSFFIAVVYNGADALQRTIGVPVELTFITLALIVLLFFISDALRRKMK